MLTAQAVVPIHRISRENSASANQQQTDQPTTMSAIFQYKLNQLVQCPNTMNKCKSNHNPIQARKFPLLMSFIAHGSFFCGKRWLKIHRQLAYSFTLLSQNDTVVKKWSIPLRQTGKVLSIFTPFCIATFWYSHYVTALETQWAKRMNQFPSKTQEMRPPHSLLSTVTEKMTFHNQWYKRYNFRQ